MVNVIKQLGNPRSLIKRKLSYINTVTQSFANLNNYIFNY